MLHGEHFGKLDDWKEAPGYVGRRIPVIRKLDYTWGQVLNPLNSVTSKKKEEYPYPLDENSDTIKVDAVPGFPLLIIVPDMDIPELSKQEYKRSIAYQIQESLLEKIEGLKRNLEKKQDEIDRLNKENRELRKEVEEREEKEASQNSRSSSSGVKCPDCGATNPEQKWEKNNDTCPSCGDVALSEAKR